MNQTERGVADQKSCFCFEYSVMGYAKARELQQQLVDLKKERRDTADFLVLLEHPPVFTLGRNAGLNNLKVSETYLKKKGVPLIRAERGGDITYHGPGQLVGYPIMDLTGSGQSVAGYVDKLEEVMIRTASEWFISAHRSPLNRGIWCNGCKLGSIGVAVRRGISFHGFALNVHVNLEPFAWINPCGLSAVGVTSMNQETSADIYMPAVRRAIRKHMQEVFGIRLEDAAPEEILTNMLKTDSAGLEKTEPDQVL